MGRHSCSALEHQVSGLQALYGVRQATSQMRAAARQTVAGQQGKRDSTDDVHANVSHEVPDATGAQQED